MLSKGKPSSNFENTATAATACPCHSDILIKSRNKFLGMLYGNILNNLSKMWHFRIGFTALLFSLQMFNHKIFNSLCIQPKGERECFFLISWTGMALPNAYSQNLGPENSVLFPTAFIQHFRQMILEFTKMFYSQERNGKFEIVFPNFGAVKWRKIGIPVDPWIQMTPTLT